MTACEQIRVRAGTAVVVDCFSDPGLWRSGMENLFSIMGHGILLASQIF